MGQQMRIRRIVGYLLLLVVIAHSADAVAVDRDRENAHLVAWWRFDDAATLDDELHPATNKATADIAQVVNAHATTREEVSGTTCDLIGFFKLVPGAQGNALRLGGISSYVEGNSGFSLPLTHGFTVESWLALGAYPVNLCPIVAQANEDHGVIFGIDADGHLELRAATGEKWVAATSHDRLPLNKWFHVACAYRPGQGIEIYIDGQFAADQRLAETVSLATKATLLIGKHPLEQQPTGVIRSQGTAAIHTYFDGVLDELKIYDGPLPAAKIGQLSRESCPTSSPDLPARKLPAGPAGPGAFGAFVKSLSYYDAWDQEWRGEPDADVVVRFDKNPCRFVFWRGTSYIPNWVTENGIWYNNAFLETWGTHGCHEPMSDKQCRYSRVEIIENGPARTVVHWRYALVDNWYKFAHVDKLTGWGDWADELYTIYPDGVAVRAATLHTSVPDAPNEWQESIVVMGPGQRPEQVLDAEAITLVNRQGESQNYSWGQATPGQAALPSHATIQLVNTKSKYKPFLVVSEQSQPRFAAYNGEVRREVSIFPWWNHWPTALDPSDGRFAVDADRASHSSLSHCYWGEYRRTSNSVTKLMLNGLTNKSPDELARLASSWDSPPKCTIVSDGFAAGNFDFAQRAYVVRRASGNYGTSLKLRVDASHESPVVNLALVVAGWGPHDAIVSIDGQPAHVRCDHRVGLDSTDLVVWIEHEANQPFSIVVNPVDNE